MERTEIRLPKEQKEWLDLYCRQYGQNKSEVIRDAIQGLKVHGQSYQEWQDMRSADAEYENSLIADLVRQIKQRLNGNRSNERIAQVVEELTGQPINQKGIEFVKKILEEN